MPSALDQEPRLSDLPGTVQFFARWSSIHLSAGLCCRQGNTQRHRLQQLGACKEPAASYKLPCNMLSDAESESRPVDQKSLPIPNPYFGRCRDRWSEKTKASKRMAPRAIIANSSRWSVGRTSQVSPPSSREVQFEMSSSCNAQSTSTTAMHSRH